MLVRCCSAVVAGMTDDTQLSNCCHTTNTMLMRVKRITHAAAVPNVCFPACWRATVGCCSATAGSRLLGQKQPCLAHLTGTGRWLGTCFTKRAAP